MEDRQSRIAWQTINKVSRRKSTAKAKLKAANQQERVKLWKQHFENLLEKAQYQLAGIYLKEQTEYIQNQRDKIRDWQTINEVSRRKSTAKAKLKAASQQERVKVWKQHFENLIGNPPKVTNEPITRIISNQLDIKLGPFTKEELDAVLRKI